MKGSHWSMERWALFFEAVVFLALALLMIRWAPIRMVMKSASLGRAGDLSPGAEMRAIDQARWAVSCAAHRLPWRPVCFPRGLAAQWMLRRRGIGSTLHHGVARNATKALVAHVWVTHRDENVIGSAAARDFTVVVSAPPFA